MNARSPEQNICQATPIPFKFGQKFDIFSSFGECLATGLKTDLSKELVVSKICCYVSQMSVSCGNKIAPGTLKVGSDLNQNHYNEMRKQRGWNTETRRNDNHKK